MYRVSEFSSHARRKTTTFCLRSCSSPSPTRTSRTHPLGVKWVWLVGEVVKFHPHDDSCSCEVVGFCMVLHSVVRPILQFFKDITRTLTMDSLRSIALPVAGASLLSAVTYYCLSRPTKPGRRKTKKQLAHNIVLFFDESGSRCYSSSDHVVDDCPIQQCPLRHLRYVCWLIILSRHLLLLYWSIMYHVCR